MSRKTNRLYKAELATRPAMFGDVGNRVKMAGIVLEGAIKPMIMLSPPSTSSSGSEFQVYKPTVDEWRFILKCSDDPVFFEQEGSEVKAIHRKMTRQISGVIQQKIWARDGFKCMLCSQQMGEVLLTVDHFVPLEHGGEGGSFESYFCMSAL